MTNLADLLPAGGGQNNTDFVADGNISSGGFLKYPDCLASVPFSPLMVCKGL